MATRAKMVPHPAQRAREADAGAVVEAQTAEAEAALLDAYGEVAEEPAVLEEDLPPDGEDEPAEQAIDEASGLPLWSEIDLDSPDTPKPTDTRTARARWRGLAFDFEFSRAKTSLAFTRALKAQIVHEELQAAKSRKNGHSPSSTLAQVSANLQDAEFIVRFLASSLVSVPLKRQGRRMGVDYESLAVEDQDLLQALYNGIQEAQQVPQA